MVNFANFATFAKFLLNFHENCCFFKPIFCENFEIAAVQKYAHLVQLEKCCQTHIFLQNFVLIQPRTSLPKIYKICKHIAKFANFVNPNAAQGSADAARPKHSSEAVMHKRGWSGRGEAADCAAEEAALLEGVRRVLFVVISRRATWREHLVLVRPRPITR